MAEGAKNHLQTSGLYLVSPITAENGSYNLIDLHGLTIQLSKKKIRRKQSRGTLTLEVNYRVKTSQEIKKLDQRVLN